MSYLVKSQVVANVSRCQINCGSATCQGHCPVAHKCALNTN